jgi:hypothetical protein
MMNPKVIKYLAAARAYRSALEQSNQVFDEISNFVHFSSMRPEELAVRTFGVQPDLAEAFGLDEPRAGDRLPPIFDHWPKSDQIAVAVHTVANAFAEQLAAWKDLAEKDRIGLSAPDRSFRLTLK